MTGHVFLRFCNFLKKEVIFRLYPHVAILDFLDRSPRKRKKWRLRVCESMAIYCYVYILSTKHVSRCILKLKIFLTIICMRNESDLFTWTVVKARQHTPCGTTQWQWGRTIEHCICLFRIRWKCCLHECAVISQFWLSHYVTSTPFLSSSVNNVILLCMLIS